jgi:hypothetical protein
MGLQKLMIDMYKKFMIYHINGLLKYQLMHYDVIYLLVWHVIVFQLIRGIFTEFCKFF